MEHDDTGPVIGCASYLRLIRDELGEHANWLIFVAVLSGVANGATVAVINAAAAENPESAVVSPRYLILFALTIIAFLVTRGYILIQSGSCLENLVCRIRDSISQKIRRCELRTFDRIGRSSIHVALSHDTANLTTAALPVFNAVGSAVMLVFCFVYILYISTPAFFITLGLTFFSAYHYRITQDVIREDLEAASERENEFFDLLNHILHGFKEVKMNDERSDDLFDNFLDPTSRETADLQIGANKLFVRNFLFAQIFFYFIIASVIFVLPSVRATSSATIAELTAVILFMIGPLSDLVGAVPHLSKADVSTAKLHRLEATLTEATHEPDGDDLPSVRLRKQTDFRDLALRGVRFSYGADGDDDAFSIGPLDFSLRKNDVIFVVGGNGSGKSTFLKTLVGLYPPDAGTVELNGVRVSDDNRETYRQFFSPIFTDFHLFDRLYGMRDVDEEEVDRLIAEMQIESKTAFHEGRFTNLDLSTGQRKRLALIVAVLEDRDILVFDEVAADQDPEFRAYYYEAILPELRAQGKTIVVVSHDDKYFHCADVIYKMEFGDISEYNPASG